MKTIIDILKKSTDYLKNCGITFPRREAELIISDALHIKRMDLYLQHDRPLIEQELDRCRKALKRRGKHEPWQHIKGFIEFYGCTIEVNPYVLIPRQETELLVDRVVQEIDNQSGILWDVCCGSGCIGIAIKKQFPKLEVYLSDVDPQALEIAQRNAEKNHVEVHFIQGDLLEPFVHQTADYIVCNPPYISPEEYELLEPEVKNFEPKKALFAEDHGLEYYKRLAVTIPTVLNPGGRVWFEIGASLGEEVKKIFNHPCWCKKELYKDLAGHNRVLMLQKK